MNKFLNQKRVYNISIAFAKIVPLSFLRKFSQFIAYLNYIFLHKARENVKKNLSNLYSDKKKITCIAKRIFLNYGVFLADWAKQNSLSTERINKWFSAVEGREYLDKALAKGTGAILLTAHLGNWELGGIFFSHENIPINVITAKDNQQQIAFIRERFRNQHNIKTITIDDGTYFFIDIINALRRNEIVAMLFDRYEGESGVEIDFFGKSTHFPVGPISLALSTQAPIIPAFTLLDGKGKYKAIIDSLIEVENTGNREKDIEVNLKKIVKIFETYILEYSDQWYNFSDLWAK